MASDRAPSTSQPTEGSLVTFLVLAVVPVGAAFALCAATEQLLFTLVGFLGPAVAYLTPVRRCRWQIVALWCIAAAAAAYTVALGTMASWWPDWLIFDDEDFTSE